MSFHTPISQRKAAGTFICDLNDTNLIQLSPNKKPCHLEQPGHNAMDSSHDSRTNFIGHTLLSNDVPRAAIFTKTGEKYILDLEDNPIAKTSSNNFTINSPRFSSPTLERISEKSTSQVSLAEKPHKSHSKVLKKPKPTKRHIIQKSRLVFTPRHVQNNTLAQLSASGDQVNPKLDNSSYFEKSKNRSTETQTECRSYNKFTTTMGCLDYIPMEGPRNLYKHSMQKYHRSYATATPPPLNIYTKWNHNSKKYSELRNLASALTFITVVSWLFSTYFDVKSLWDCLDNLLDYLQSFFQTQQKPKTKVETLIEFLQDLWS